SGACCDMGDEIAGDISLGHIWNRTGAGIVVAVAVSAPASDVKDPEADDRENCVPGTSERSERDHEDVDDSRVVEPVRLRRRERRRRVPTPVVAPGTGGGARVRPSEHPVLDALGELTQRCAGLNPYEGDAVRLCHGKNRRLAAPGAGKGPIVVNCVV